MKLSKLSIIAATLAMSCAASAAPFIVSDPLDTTATHCGITLDAAPKVNSPVLVTGPNKTCHHDVAAVSVGTHNVTVTAMRIGDPVWGNAESNGVAFTFVRPAAPTAPTNIVISAL